MTLNKSKLAFEIEEAAHSWVNTILRDYLGKEDVFYMHFWFKDDIIRDDNYIRIRICTSVGEVEGYYVRSLDQILVMEKELAKL